MSTKPEKLEALQQTWKEAYAKFGKGSKEEIAAYQAYIKEKQGEGKRSRKVRSFLQTQRRK
jgi:hypothetical protein